MSSSEEELRNQYDYIKRRDELRNVSKDSESGLLNFNFSLIFRHKVMKGKKKIQKEEIC